MLSRCFARQFGKLSLLSSLSMKPHPEKAHKGGEDAAFVEQSIVGVFDGVGGWQEHGVDPADYSRQLKKGSLEYIRNHKQYSLKEVLAHAHDSAKDVVGSSTACLARLIPEETKLETLNLGDSGFFYFKRDDENNRFEVIYAAEEQRYGFNCPAQLGTGWELTANEAASQDITPSHGDILLMATDGMFDNVFVFEIEDLLSNSELLSLKDMKNVTKDDVQRMTDEFAAELTELTFEKASRDHGFSPFAIEAKQFNIPFEGGKLDDITIILSAIVDEDTLA
eukprot:TRINITY_DN15290_c1_g1_i1.p1 TRINITY_DN15290_c1_g1~~TRINITY_DN15290_c1_g1_i1.p1  ORF type:complete len:280 (-),score=82.06 TRINITY_DN15290_c1_g1_i1:258-1097(-)